MALFDERGRQIPDPRPIEVPVGFGRPLSLQEEIRRFVRQELSKVAGDNEMETFEEADDFDVDDEDELPMSPYEVVELGPEPGDKDADPPPDPKARTPVKLAEGSGGGSGGETPPAPDDVQVKADSLTKS